MVDIKKLLIEEIERVPFEKLSNLLSYAQFLVFGEGEHLYIDPEEEAYLDALYEEGDAITDEEMRILIEGLPND